MLFNQIIFSLVTGIADHIKSDTRREILPVISAVAMNILTRLQWKTVNFQDHAYLGLPMDNFVDEILVPFMFTEIWVPLSCATKATNAISDYFNSSSKDHFSCTGDNAWELYAAKATDAWLNMSYSNGTDVEGWSFSYWPILVCTQQWGLYWSLSANLNTVTY